VIDNDYRGHRAALWIFWAVLVMRIAISINSIFNGRGVARDADGIPIDSWPASAAQTVIAMFAVWGLAQLVISLLCVVALVRYRGAVPFLFSVLLAEQVARRIILMVQPIIRDASIAHWVNFGLLTATAIGVALSFWPRREHEGDRLRAVRVR
jgi:lysylphosphatidylglycerol synthetase-like protein (DUF2156 family)